LAVDALAKTCTLDRPEEVLITDTRAGLSPSDMVERKLMRLLHDRSVASCEK
jgi:hypothetical protein